MRNRALGKMVEKLVDVLEARDERLQEEVQEVRASALAAQAELRAALPQQALVADPRFAMTAPRSACLLRTS